MKSFKLTLVAVFASAASVMACSAGADDSVIAKADTDQVDTECMKGMNCHPVVKSGGFGAFAGTTGTLQFEDTGPTAGPTFACTGAGPEGGGANYQAVRPDLSKSEYQCWSVLPLQVDGGIGWGYTMLSTYICPAGFTVNRCDPYGRCQCWSY